MSEWDYYWSNKSVCVFLLSIFTTCDCTLARCTTLFSQSALWVMLKMNGKEQYHDDNSNKKKNTSANDYD